VSGLAEVLSNLGKWAEEKRAGCEGVARVTAVNAQNYARQNHPWINRTGHAQAGLNGGSFWESPSILKTYLAHSMSYGVFLELANDRKYQILEESLNQYKDSFYNGIKRIMEH
jgi:predicted peptidase